jgi:hypothetical protein
MAERWGFGRLCSSLALTLTLLVLAGCGGAARSTSDPPAMTETSSRDARARDAAKAECQYLRYGSHWSRLRAFEAIKRDFAGDTQSAAEVGCIEVYNRP